MWVVKPFFILANIFFKSNLDHRSGNFSFDLAFVSAKAGLAEVVKLSS